MTLSHPEQQAVAATNLPVFAVNIPEIRRAVEEILSTFGRMGIFSEYTRHDITHIDGMFRTLEWVIPERSHAALSKGDWLTLVLSIYFHDMGLIVTEEEYRERDKSGFNDFCERHLFSFDHGADYRAKVNLMDDETRSKFLYQEFVRHNHGRRVRAWIEGDTSPEFGRASAQIAEVSRLLQPLDSDFRRDLGMVCESHNLDDIDDLSKYRVAHPYGDSDDETVNLHYCAIILRTVDLLQITSQRAPSALYRIINPSDPVSQVEWKKQAFVKRVRPKTGVNKDGDADDTMPKDTIEVFANFDNDAGFFGLTSYLRYASSQVAASYNSFEKSKRLTTKKYAYPWREIDDSNINVKGFIKQPFEFEIDQSKVLDLLTGHTLYNNSNVVLRELTQNAIDAVRLYAARNGQNSRDHGKVEIRWDSKNLVLEIKDNGTGMTQSVIENHLLKVGSSFYQDPKFKENNPDFNSISRFGIGVLSSFMVADSVEIITVSPDEEEARQISLRSVHGKYLIRLLDKRIDPEVTAIGSHGTVFRLTFRPNSKRMDVLETVQRWILFPRCSVYVSVDEEAPVLIGYRSPKDALETYLTPSQARDKGLGVKFKVIEKTIDGFTLAFALRYSSHYKDWSFFTVPHLGYRSNRGNEEFVPIATCIEGIAVEFETPGYRNGRVMVLADATGKNAPKTNVARTAIEELDTEDSSIGKTYKILFDSVEEEVRRLIDEEGYSMTWAMDQMPYIISPVLSHRHEVSHTKAYDKAVNSVHMYLVEKDGQRKAVSLDELRREGSFWTTQSQLMRSVEQFIREAKSEVTASQLIEVSQGTSASMPSGIVLANSSYGFDKVDLITSNFEVSEMSGIMSDRRLDLKWESVDNRWIDMDHLRNRIYRSRDVTCFDLMQRMEEYSSRMQRGVVDVMVPRQAIATTGLDDYCAVSVYENLWIVDETPIAKLFSINAESWLQDPKECTDRFIFLQAIANASASGSIRPESVERYFRQFDDTSLTFPANKIEELLEAVSATEQRRRIFNPLSWNKREDSGNNHHFS